MITKTMSFPKMFNYINNKINTVSGEESIQQSLTILFKSAVRELLGDPEYGSLINEYIFMTTGNSLQELLKSDILYRISMYERRITVSEEDIHFYYDEKTPNTIYANINYVNKGTGEMNVFTLNLSEGGSQ